MDEGDKCLPLVCLQETQTCKKPPEIYLVIRDCYYKMAPQEIVSFRRIAQHVSDTAPPSNADFAYARVYQRDQHPVSRKQISNNTLKVMKQLRDAGFRAYLVGGAVRDMILGKHPKDFDVATDATPEQIRKIFRNSRIIGRRFRIIHVHFGREIIEVTTFRGHHKAEAGNHVSASNEQGMLLRDNVYGTIEEDALRRDFTINALYYSSEDFCVYDFTDGFNDLQNKVLRLIGDPAQRYREDPVRILRAVRFAAKLGFSLDDTTFHAIDENAPLLRNIPPARLFDELLKLLCTGYGEQSLEQLLEHRLLAHLISNSERITADPQALQLLQTALSNSDTRVKKDMGISPTFILAALFWPHLKQSEAGLASNKLPPLTTRQQAADIVLQQQSSYTSIPKRIQLGIKDIWEMQLRLQSRRGNRVLRLLQHPRFRAGYDFVLLREQCGEQLDGLGQWWTDLQNMDEEQQQQAVQAVAGSAAGKKPRKRPARKRKPPTPA